MVQSVNSSNTGQNAVSRLLESTSSMRATALKPAKNALQSNVRVETGKPGAAPQRMLQNLMKMMGQLLEAIKSMLTQFMQGLGGVASGKADPATQVADANQSGMGEINPSEAASESNSSSASGSANGVTSGNTTASGGVSTTGSDIDGDVKPDPIAVDDSDDEDLLPEEAANFRAAPKPSAQRDPLQAVTDDKGLPTVITEDGYTIHCDADKASWSITGPDGKTTQIWGDPHVVESDNDKWDFKNQSTFKFGNNKITVQVAPYGDGSTTVTSRITIYSGEQRVTIGGIDKAQPRIEASANDGRTHDAALQDGDTYQRSLEPGRGDGEQWKKVASMQ